MPGCGLGSHTFTGTVGVAFGWRLFFLMPKPGRDAFLPFSGFNLLGTPHNSLLLMQSLARPVEHYS